MWVVNAEGVYIETRAYHSYLVDDILTAINEKYGTNFSSITYLREPSITIGDDCPNWNAYEKISNLVYIKIQGPGIAGFIKDETGFIYTKNNKYYYFNLETGEVRGVSVQSLDDEFKNSIISWVDAAGLNITQVEPKEENFEIGQVMQNWNEYVTIKL